MAVSTECSVLLQLRMERHWTIYLSEADCVSVKFPDHTKKDCNGQPLPGSYAQHIQKQQELAIYGYGDESESYDVLSQLPPKASVSGIM